MEKGKEGVGLGQFCFQASSELYWLASVECRDG